MNPRPIAVRPLPKYELEIKFANGETRIFDLKPYLELGIFRELSDISYFKQVQIQNSTVVWPNEQDICPDTLYLEGRTVTNDGAA